MQQKKLNLWKEKIRKVHIQIKMDKKFVVIMKSVLRYKCNINTSQISQMFVTFKYLKF